MRWAKQSGISASEETVSSFARNTLSCIHWLLAGFVAFSPKATRTPGSPSQRTAIVLHSIWNSVAHLATRFRCPASGPTLSKKSYDSRSVPRPMLTGGKACLEFAWSYRKGSAPMPVLNASPIILASLGISKLWMKIRPGGGDICLRESKWMKQGIGSAEQADPSSLFLNAPPVQRWRSSRTNGLSRPPKQLPYILEASPSPVNRDYMGASSSWSGANLPQNLHCERWR